MAWTEVIRTGMQGAARVQSARRMRNNKKKNSFLSWSWHATVMMGWTEFDGNKASEAKHTMASISFTKWDASPSRWYAGSTTSSYKYLHTQLDT